MDQKLILVKPFNCFHLNSKEPLQIIKRINYIFQVNGNIKKLFILANF